MSNSIPKYILKIMFLNLFEVIKTYSIEIVNYIYISKE